MANPIISYTSIYGTLFMNRLQSLNKEVWNNFIKIKTHVNKRFYIHLDIGISIFFIRDYNIRLKTEYFALYVDDIKFYESNLSPNESSVQIFFEKKIMVDWYDQNKDLVIMFNDIIKNR